jgi:hypothetical protein
MNGIVKQIKVSEHDEQVAVVDWLFLQSPKYPELDLVFAVPNGAMLGGGRIGAIRANALKAEGMRPGAPDLVIPSARGGYFGVFLEMKTKKGKLSENQEQFIVQAEKQGYMCFVAYGAEEAIEMLEGYLKKPYTKDIFEVMFRERVNK